MQYVSIASAPMAPTPNDPGGSGSRTAEVVSDTNAASSPAFMSITTETRTEYLLRTRQAAPRFLQGVYPFAGRGVFDLAPLHDELAYVVPSGKTAQVLYFRAGNLSDDLLYLTLGANGQPVRYFPVGPKSDFHVPLVIVEDYPAGTRLQVCIAAPRGLTGSVVVDVGVMEMDAASSGTGIVMADGRA